MLDLSVLLEGVVLSVLLVSVVRLVPTRSVLLDPRVFGVVPTELLRESDEPTRVDVLVPRVVVPTRVPVTIRPLASRTTPLRDEVRVLSIVDDRLEFVVPTRLLKLSRFCERTEDPIDLPA